MKPKPDLLENEMKGRLKRTGKHFEINDSDYLNITLDSREKIDLWLESMPEMITLRIKETTKDNLTPSTEITINGLNPNATYHKYEDHYYNHLVFTTDKNGKYVFKQDISKSHTIFIQSRASTYFLKETGWEDSSGTPLSPLIATWDSTLRIAKLEADIFDESIEIEVDDATLNGQRHTTTGSLTGAGIYLASGRHDVIIKNLEIKKFYWGIYFNGNNINNTIENNTISTNQETGISLDDGNIYNNIENNIISDNGYGIHFLSNNDTNNIVNNTIYDNIRGIFFYDNNDMNIITQNCIFNNTTGIRIISYNSYNQFKNNNFVNSTTGTNAFNDDDNTFDSNYWDDWSGSGSYSISPTGQDNNPLLVPWDVTPPTTTINLSGTLGDNDWYTSDVQVALTAEDTYPCSLGIQNTLYSLDGTTWNNYTSPFSISDEGIITVYYYSVDKSGNREYTKTKEVKIDKTPPEIIINIPADGSECLLDETVIADWSVSDAYSGVAYSSGTVPSGAPIDTSSLGEKSFIVTATDNAGNSISQTTKYYVRSHTPQIRISWISINARELEL